MQRKMAKESNETEGTKQEQKREECCVESGNIKQGEESVKKNIRKKEHRNIEQERDRDKKQRKEGVKK